nr:hypothetical protein [uncultured Chryseobacterium sp.]
MKEIIINTIKKLGGNTTVVSPDKTFAENWKNINFNNYLYDNN